MFVYHIVAKQENHSYTQLVRYITRVTPVEYHAYHIGLWSAMICNKSSLLWLRNMDPVPTSHQNVGAVPPTLPSQDLQFCLCICIFWISRSVESLVTRAQLRCDGHVVRMDSKGISNALVFVELSLGK